ncbi:MAG: M18 family aminopeptidase [Chlamydiota bacterium]
MSHIVEDFKAFLETSPTSWHAVQETSNRLALHDFTPLEENEKWELEGGKSYFVARGGALIAFTLPKQTPNKALIIAAHTDSPALKLKPRPEFSKENMTLFGTEVYGGPLLSSWLNRDLAIAGRVFVTNSRGDIEEKLVFLDDAPLIIPQLAIHLDRDVNEKGVILNKQQHLSPLVTLEKGDLESLLRRHISFHTLLSFDLLLVPIESSRFVGAHGELLASYRIDNLTSVHAATVALCRSCTSPTEALKIAVFWDHEEIGSGSSEGALSPFLTDLLVRIGHALKLSNEELFMLKSHSFCISADMAHALNPNYVEKHDPQHMPLMGKGIVLKYNANHKYATNGSTAATIIDLCQKLNLSYQPFAARSDIPSGSTVGPFIEQKLGIKTADIGVAQLSMHSAREIIAWQDYVDLTELLTHFLGN